MVSPIMMERIKIVPQNPDHRFSSEITINSHRVIDSYIELRVRYESVYSKELGDPPHLSGDLVRRYGFIDGEIRRFQCLKER